MPLPLTGRELSGRTCARTGLREYTKAPHRVDATPPIAQTPRAREFVVARPSAMLQRPARRRELHILHCHHRPLIGPARHKLPNLGEAKDASYEM